jgi:flagellar hook-associated protein 1 FlgK
MTSPFFGLDIATRSLRAQQMLVDVANQNIANANTPGYSRQEAVVKETLPYPIPVFRQSGEAGQLGTGVEVKEINRSRDLFADYQYRNQVAAQGNWDAQSSGLKQIEAVVNEPSTSGLSTLMTRYWQAWQEVGNSPSDVSVRANLLEQGKALAESFQSTVHQFQQQQRDVDNQVSLTVDDVNNYAKQIANLNTQISQVETGGMKANDLRDQRDLLLDKLSSLVNITSVESSEGSVNVYVAGHQLVDRSVAHTVGLDRSGVFAQVVWADGTNTPLVPADGRLAGLMHSRDVDIQGRIDSINVLASRIIQSVNAVHSAGVGIDGTAGRNFFSGTNAVDMSIDPTLTTSGIAAARPTGTTPAYAAGDSSNAVALAQVQNAVTQHVPVPPTPSEMVNGKALASTTILGVDVGGAAVNKTFTFTYNGATVTVSDGTNTRTAQLTTFADPTTGRTVYTLDTGTAGVQDATLGPGLGVRLTFSAASSVPTATALNDLNSQGGQRVTTQGPSTVNDQYAQEIAAIGVKSSTAQGQAANQKVMVTQLQRQRQDIGGVSLDEEATHLIQYQHAYQAAARVISVMDSMLDTLINHTGVA